MDAIPREPARRWHPLIRVAVSLVSAVVFAYGAAALLFFGLIVWSGCFIECSYTDQNPVGGFFLILAGLAAAAGVVTSIAAAMAGARAPLQAIFFWAMLAAGVLLGILFLNG